MMKKMFLVCACVLSMSVQASEQKHGFLMKLFEPVFQIATQKSMMEDEDKNPQYQTCVAQILNVHVFPDAMSQALKKVSKGKDAPKIQALESFFAQPEEREVFSQKQTKITQLLAENKVTDAESLWDAYADQVTDRMPKDVQMGLNKLANALDIDKVMDQKDITDLMFSEPVCVDYMKSLVNE